jgi:hypothetical protein
VEKTKQLPNYNLFRRPRGRVIRELNNIVVITGIARNAVEDARKTLQSGPRTKLRFKVPSVKDEQVVAARNRSKILSLLEQAVSRDIFSQALVPAVAVTEGYLAHMLKLVLRAFPKKLGVSEKKVDLAVILEAEDLDDLLDAIISKQINSAFYGSPSKYFEYIESVLSISIPPSRKDAYSEVKATRDIYVHNGGIANRLYLQKAGRLARVGDGDPLPLDEKYFSKAITCMKGVVKSVYKGLLKKYGESKELAG